MMKVWQVSLGLLMTLALLVNAFTTAEAQESDSDLAKKSQNPVADLISIPLQNNMGFGIGPNNRTRNDLNLQPVVPINLNSEWNLITRTILPIVKQPTLSTTSDDTWGIGNTSFSAFFSPAKSTGLIWGAGPIVEFPTITDDRLGTRKWSAGPTAVVLTTHGPWVFGILGSQIWSFAGSSDNPNVSRFLTQYFVNYNFGEGWYLSSAPIITANWQAPGSNKWTVPVGGGVGKVFRIGKLPFNANLGYYAHVIRPDPSADAVVRFQIALLLPKSIFSH